MCLNITLFMDIFYSGLRSDIHTFCFKQYNLDIADGNQVLLVSHVKKVLVPSGGPPPGPAMLIPELCFLTGLQSYSPV